MTSWLFFFSHHSILGMHIFGCKFSLKTDAGDTVPDRKNFDSLLWAIVTVFQVTIVGLTQYTPPSKKKKRLPLSWDGLIKWIYDMTVLYAHQKYSLCSPLCVDSDSGRLEYGAVQWHGINLPLCRSLLCSTYDIWKLRALQFTSRHPGWRFSSWGETSSSFLSWQFLLRSASNCLLFPHSFLFLLGVCFIFLPSRRLCLCTSSLAAPPQGDANRSYSDDDRSSCNFDENDKQKDSLHLSGMNASIFCNITAKLICPFQNSQNLQSKICKNLANGEYEMHYLMSSARY